ncbi:MAG TPA: hypothetical protein VIV12_01890 [Streptosporangiaceae bacterium]
MSEKIGRLFDYAAAQPEGFTYQDVEKELGWRRSQFIKVARQLRLMLGNDDQINLVCDVEARNAPWRYRLVGNFDQAREWGRNRTDDAESRLTTISGVLASVVKATDGRSRDGRRARIMQRAITRAKEDLAEIDNGPPLFGGDAS